MKRRILLGIFMVLFVFSIILYIQYYRDIKTAYQGAADGNSMLMTYKSIFSTRIVNSIQKSDFAYWLEYVRRHILH